MRAWVHIFLMLTLHLELLFFLLIKKTDKNRHLSCLNLIDFDLGLKISRFCPLLLMSEYCNNCFCCGCYLVPRYKRLVNNVFPQNPQVNK